MALSIFCFKQKTAYEMRISEWSSDVCSSDLADMMGSMGAGMAGMSHSAMAMTGASTQVRHARTEYGASIDMRVDMPRTHLDDPGIGLRNNGRRVLTLSALHTVGGEMEPRGAERESELHLTGNQ